MSNLKYLAYAVLLAALVSLPFYSGAYIIQTTYIIMMYMALAISWDMLLRAGQLSFGIAGLFGLGSYTACLLQFFTGINPLLCILAGALVAGIAALLLGLATLRLRGMYFAIITLATAEIFRVIIRNLPEEWAGGAFGVVIPTTIFGGDAKMTYWLVLALAVMTIALSEFFNRSRIHFAVTSIRNDEIVAMSTGIDIFKYLVFIFVITSFIQGMVGATYTEIYGFVNPESSFSATFSLLPLAMALFGGIRSTWGPVIGAIILGLAGEYLKLIMPYGYLIIYGLIIILVILFLPDGIMGLIRKISSRREV